MSRDMTITGLAYLDDRRLVSVSLDGSVRIWDAATYISGSMKK